MRRKMKSIANLKTMVVIVFMMLLVVSLQVTAAEITEVPTIEPTEVPIKTPAIEPTAAPTEVPTMEPTAAPAEIPTMEPTAAPTEAPTIEPTVAPTEVPTIEPTVPPTEAPTIEPTEPPTETPTEEPEEVEKIPVAELDMGDYQKEMVLGTNQVLYVTVLPLNAADTSLTYKSSDTKVATVNGMGRITAKALGKAVITVTAGEISQKIEISVVAEKDDTILVRDIEIGNYEEELEVDKTVTISGTVLPADATNSTITYISSDPSIATVSSTGEVKGIKAGDVTITLMAGSVVKTVNLRVKVATTGITLNSDYLTLRPDETFQLSAKVLPSSAPQRVTYKSSDDTIATVSKEGLVTGIGVGTTMIIISNGDSSVAASVIVNQSVNYQQKEENAKGKIEEEIHYSNIIYSREQSVVDSQMLKYFYETKQTLTIVSEDYTIEIAGEDIVNYNNKLYTDILLKKDEDVLSFTLNQKEDLCGAIILYLNENDGKYLYLHNDAKGKYELLDADNLKMLKLTTAGEYQIWDTKLKMDLKIVLYGCVAGIIIVLIGIGVYIVTKKRYWFW